MKKAYMCLSKNFVFVFLMILFIGTAFAEEIKIGAGAAATENILKPIKSEFEKKFNINLTILPWGPVKAIQDLDAGLIDIAGIGLSFEEILDTLKKEKITISNINLLQPIQVGVDSLKVIVNKSNPVFRLTKEELKQIFTGKILNWKDVGGKDEIITIVYGKMNTGANIKFKEIIMDGEEYYTDAFLEATTSEDIIEKVTKHTDAIAFVPVGAINQNVKVVEAPEVTRPIIFITKGQPTEKVKKLINFIQNEGRSLIKK